MGAHHQYHVLLRTRRSRLAVIRREEPAATAAAASLSMLEINLWSIYRLPTGATTIGSRRERLA